MIFRRSVVIYYIYSLVTTSTTIRFYNNTNHTKRLISTVFTTTAFKYTNQYSRNNNYYNNIQRINTNPKRNQYNKNNIFQQQFILTINNNNNNNNILLTSQSMSTSSTTTTENSNNNNNNNNNVEPTTTEEEQEVVNNNTDSNDDLRNVGRNYCTILNHINDIAIQCHRNPSSIRLVAVSKTKSIDSIIEAYNVGHCRYFGENYVQELITKINTLSLLNSEMYNTIQWHFIGTLQSNKCQMLMNNINNINQLTIETITSIKLANKLNTVIENKMKTLYNKDDDNDCDDSINTNDDNSKELRLKVFVQINTSGEESKGGVEPTTNSTACIELCEYIILHCQYLQLCGLMTIGAPNDTSCFTTLVQCRDDVLLHFKNNQEDNNEAYNDKCIDVPTELELSMGMSDDYVDAIRAGSTNVRIGSSIFGHRIYTIK